MKRTLAATLIDEVRVLAAGGVPHGQTLEHALRMTLQAYNLEPLVPCDGEAHSNAYIDSCHRCAPRWAWVGKLEPVT